MTDAPERIWAWVDRLNGLNVSGTSRKPSTYFENYYAEYARADLVPRWSSDMAAAPKDGTPVHLFPCGRSWTGDAISGVGWFSHFWEDWVSPSASDLAPTHWKPLDLPAPPKGETK